MSVAPPSVNRNTEVSDLREIKSYKENFVFIPFETEARYAQTAIQFFSSCYQVHHHKTQPGSAPTDTLPTKPLQKHLNCLILS